MLTFELLHPQATREHLGFIPLFLSLDDPRSAREQIDANYQHGGGWNPLSAFVRGPGHSLTYPEDPSQYPLAWAELREETIFIYEGGLTMILQPDGSFEAARLD